MTFLPIVQRELRAAARRRSTFRVRWWATVLGLGLCLISLMSISMSRGRGVGNPLFNLLTGYGFGLGLLAGVFLTSDTLTEEKREGTLGLLFLTDLKGYDVVLGKFIAQSLNAFYCLMALLPITALPIMLGGVVGAEFWRMALALTNALFFSLTAGICVSACMRDSQRAMANTFGLVLLMVAAVPLLRNLGTALKVPAGWLALAWVSPLYPFSYASETMYTRHSGIYWASLAASQFLGWCFLGAASVALPRVLREHTKSVSSRRAWKSVPAGLRRARPRPELLTANPVQWLTRDDLRFPWAAWLIALAWAGAVVVFLVLGGSELPVSSGLWAIPFGFFLKALFAIQACRFFAEARRSGALELLLCTPLTDQQIIRGQIRALWAAFALPLAVFVAGLFAPAILAWMKVLSTRNFESFTQILGGTLLSGAYTARLVADLFAILWFGMGLALTSRKPRLAPALTILFVLVLPGPLSFCWLDVLLDLIFISWGASKCRQNLRRLIAEQYQVVSPLPASPGSAIGQSIAPSRVPPVIGTTV